MCSFPKGGQVLHLLPPPLSYWMLLRYTIKFLSFFCPLFLPPRHLLWSQNSKCSKDGYLSLRGFQSHGPGRINLECTLTLDCVGCVFFSRKSPAFHPFECHLFMPFYCPPEFFCSYCGSHVGIDQWWIGSVHLWISKPLLHCILTFHSCWS